MAKIKHSIYSETKHKKRRGIHSKNASKNQNAFKKKSRGQN